jgi:protein gp37
MTTLGSYTVHPAADAFPMMSDEELKDLAADIKTNGLINPITISYDGKSLLDGRNRFRACEIAGADTTECKLGPHYTEQMIIDYIVSANIKRRHLSAGQLAMLGADLEPIYAAAAKQRQREAGGGAGRRGGDTRNAGGKSATSVKAREEAATKVGTSGRSVGKAKVIKDEAPDLAKKIRDGQLTLDKADKERKAREAAKPGESQPKEPKPSKKHTAEPIKLTLVTHEGVKVPYPMPKAKATFNETKGEGISWAAWSWNPVTGCLHNCPYCYAREIATTERFAPYYPVGFTPLFHHERLDAPANTKLSAARRDDPAYRRVFVCSMADLYGRWVPDEWINRVHDSMLASPQWQYILLTKFPERYAGLKLPDGAWVGTSVDEQKRVRIAERAFRKIPAGVTKWLSLEPLKAPLQFEDLSMFDWVVIGAQTQTWQPDGFVESFAPPFEWVSRIVAQAREAGCAVHLKPNLLGHVDGNSPGMTLPDEYPPSGNCGCPS